MGLDTLLILLSAPSSFSSQWSEHTLRGWWNEHSPGPAPDTTLIDYDYIVVGSGAGGAPLAARLGLAGYRVLVLEAGEDVTPYDDNVTVPLWAPKSTEDPKLAWSFYVDHYPDMFRNAKDPKYNYKLANGSIHTGLDPPANATPLGVLYPRAAALGGCSIHNYLVMMYPFDSDWDAIANLTGDASWQSATMRGYFERLERNQYVPAGSPGHGFDGWMSTNRAQTSIFLSDDKFYQMMKVRESICSNPSTHVDL